MATHLRDLLIEHGILTPVNRDLVAFEDWLSNHLPGYPPAAEKLLRRFATWHHLRRMRDLAEQGKLTRRTVYTAEQQINVAGQFLHYLDDRHIPYIQLRQAHIDSWLAAGPTTRYTARTFVSWAGSTRRLPVVRFPNRSDRTRPILDQPERLRLLDLCFRPETAPLSVRIAGILVLLYAQSVTRISRLPLENVVEDGTTMTIIFGTAAAPLPPPVADLIREHLAHRPNMATAANTVSPWLFPGVRPGQPITANWLTIQLHNLGIRPRAARNSALRQLVMDMPPPVAAEALGYSPNTTERHAKDSGTIWSFYVGNRHR